MALTECHVTVGYSFGSIIHEIGFPISDNQFNSYSAAVDSAFQTSVNDIITALRGLVSTEVSFFTARLRNKLGAVTREIVFASQSGTHTPSKRSNSFSLGLSYIITASGISGKARNFCPKLFLGHSDFALQGYKRLVASDFTEVSTALPLIRSNIPVSTANGQLATKRGYLTTQFNSRTQQDYGS